MRVKLSLNQRQPLWVLASLALAGCGPLPPVRTDPPRVESPAADSSSASRAALPATAPDASDAPAVTRKPGVLVMAHGGSPEWNRAVEAAVQPLAERTPTSIAFGMADPETLARSLRSLEERGVERVAVVRLFISGSSFLETTRYVFGQREELPRRARVTPGDPYSPRPIETSSEILIDLEGLAESEEAGRILVARAQSVSRDPESEALLILGHGVGDPERNARLLDRMERHADTVRGSLPFPEVRVETLREDWPEARSAAEARIRDWVETQSSAGRRVLVVPYRLFGFGPYAEMLDGLEYATDGVGFLPHPAITEWLLDRARTMLGSTGRELLTTGPRLRSPRGSRPR